MKYLKNYRFVKPVAAQLMGRSFILISGQQTTQFLQGLISQDINNLRLKPDGFHSLKQHTLRREVEHHTSTPTPFLHLPSIPALFLSSTGKILFDCFIYNVSTHERAFNDSAFLIDCGNDRAKHLLRLLTIRKLRLPIVVNDASDIVSASQLLTPSYLNAALSFDDCNNKQSNSHNTCGDSSASTEAESIHSAPSDSPYDALSWLTTLDNCKLDACFTELHSLLNHALEKADTSVYTLLRALRQSQCISYISEDPRYYRMGYRLIYPTQYASTIHSMFESSGSHNTTSLHELCTTLRGSSSHSTTNSTHQTEDLSNCVDIQHGDAYTFIRYINGIPEGPIDVPIDEIIPMYYNFDFLNYISANKGCYVGQELMSRILNTLQIRKRIFITVPIEDDSTAGLPNLLHMDDKKYLLVGHPRIPLSDVTSDLGGPEKTNVNIIHKFGTLVASNGLAGLVVLRSWGTVTVLKKELECCLLEKALSKMMLYLIDTDLYDKNMSPTDLSAAASATVLVYAPPYVK